MSICFVVSGSGLIMADKNRQGYYALFVRNGMTSKISRQSGNNMERGRYNEF